MWGFVTPRDNRCVPLTGDTFGTRRHLPHLEHHGKTYFVTFVTRGRIELPAKARDIVLETIIRDHQVAYWLHCTVVMPDHVHLIATLYETWSMTRALQRVKGASSHSVNRALDRRGSLWQDESFDRIIRAGENIRTKSQYVIENPIRAGLVAKDESYPWLWREWIEGV